MVELSFSLVFISLLSLAIVLIIMNTISSYRKGITLSQVNSAGTEVVDDMRVAVQNASASSVESMCTSHYQTSTSGAGASDAEAACMDNNAKYFVTITWNGSVRLSGATETMENIPLFGAFCSGTYSYIWNSGYYFGEGNEVTTGGTIKNGADAGAVSVSFGNAPSGTARVWYRNKEDKLVDVSGFRLLKIRDDSRAICASKATAGSADKYQPFRPDGKMATNIFDITFADTMQIDEDPVDLLSNSDSGLALYNLDVATPAENSAGDNLFYAASFILGTISGGPNIKSGGNCTLPDGEADSNFDYCAINKFSFAVQAVGE